MVIGEAAGSGDKHDTKEEKTANHQDDRCDMQPLYQCGKKCHVDATCDTENVRMGVNVGYQDDLTAVHESVQCMKLTN